MALHPVYRIMVYVPPDSLQAVLEAALRQTPLRFGKYDHVAHWTSVGVEHFRPLPGSTPAVGAVDAVTRIDTVLLEFAIPRDHELLGRVMGDLLETHPWEEPVVFVDESLASGSHFDLT